MKENKINELTEKYCMAMAVLEIEYNRLNESYNPYAEIMEMDKHMFQTNTMSNAIEFLKERLKYLQETLTPSELSESEVQK